MFGCHREETGPAMARGLFTLEDWRTAWRPKVIVYCKSGCVPTIRGANLSIIEDPDFRFCLLLDEQLSRQNVSGRKESPLAQDSANFVEYLVVNVRCAGRDRKLERRRKL